MPSRKALNLDIDNLIFDLDGTLMDSRQIFLECYFAVFGKEGIDVDIEQVLDLVGMGVKLRNVIEGLVPEDLREADPSIVNRLEKEYKTFFGQRCVEETVPFPCAIETLQGLRDMGKRTALATSKLRVFTLKILEGRGMTGLFDAIVAGDDVLHEKPHPEPILKILEGCKWDRHSTIFTGDTVADIIAGRAAEVCTCGVLCGFGKRSDLMAAGPDFLATDVSDLLYIVK